MAFLNSTIGKQETAAHLLTKHNVRYLLRLMGRFRKAIFDGRLESFVLEYMESYYGEKEKFPDFVKEGLNLAGFSY